MCIQKAKIKTSLRSKERKSTTKRHGTGGAETQTPDEGAGLWVEVTSSRDGDFI